MNLLNRQPTRSEVHDYRRDGVVHIHGAVALEWVEQIKSAIESDLPNANYGSDRLFCDGMMMWQRDPIFKAYSHDSHLAEAAAKLMGARKINLLYDQYLVKEPGGSASVGKTRWHHDQPYWPIRGNQITTLWLALDDIDNSTGQVEFIAGSHNWTHLFQPEGLTEEGYQYEKNSEYKKIPDIDANRDEYPVKSWNMRPGDLLAFHGRTVHGAKGNQNQSRRRRALAIRYVGEDVTYYDGPGSFDALRVPDLKNGGTLDCDSYPVIWQSDHDPV